nr:uncharacterized protein LOC127310475 [Lolium perenne]
MIGPTPKSPRPLTNHHMLKKQQLTNHPTTSTFSHLVTLHAAPKSSPAGEPASPPPTGATRTPPLPASLLLPRRRRAPYFPGRPPPRTRSSYLRLSTRAPSAPASLRAAHRRIPVPPASLRPAATALALLRAARRRPRPTRRRAPLPPPRCEPRPAAPAPRASLRATRRRRGPLPPPCCEPRAAAGNRFPVRRRLGRRQLCRSSLFVSLDGSTNLLTDAVYLVVKLSADGL